MASVSSVMLTEFIEEELKMLWLDKKPTKMSPEKSRQMAENWDELFPSEKQVKGFCRSWRDTQDNFPTTKDFVAWMRNQRQFEPDTTESKCRHGLCDGSGAIPVSVKGEAKANWMNESHMWCGCHKACEEGSLVVGCSDRNQLNQRLSQHGKEIHPGWLAEQSHFKPNNEPEVTMGTVQFCIDCWDNLGLNPEGVFKHLNEQEITVAGSYKQGDMSGEQLRDVVGVGWHELPKARNEALMCPF